MFRVIVCGSRWFTNKDFIFEKLTNLLRQYSFSQIEIVEGECEGPDKIAAMWAVKNKCKVKPFYASWKEFGKSAGPKRNYEMVNYADACIAFWDGESKGTLNMINYAKQFNLKLRIVKI